MRPSLLFLASALAVHAEHNETKSELMMRLMQEDYDSNPLPEVFSLALGKIECRDGFAAGYPCKNVDLLSFLSHADMGSKTKTGNDIWGWTDSETGREYAIVCQTDGTAFVDITDPEMPEYKGRLPTKTGNSIWRDAKVYKNHVFIVSEAYRHGVQVFDLRQLRATGSPQIFRETAYYPQTGKCHNIAINEETGFAYCIGSRDVCSGGLYSIDISNPSLPKYAGCFPDDGYVHDTRLFILIVECVIYKGPDSRFFGQEICFAFNEDSLTIVNVENKAKPVMLSRTVYKGYAYTHQGWLTDDHRFMLLDDELDEKYSKERGQDGNTVTYMWDVTDLTNPINTNRYISPVTSIDHNLYIRGRYAYLSNYASGLRILDISGISNANATEIAYFDVRPEDDKVIFQGTWSNYPFFKSGNVIINSIERGLFVVRPRFNMDK